MTLRDEGWAMQPGSPSQDAAGVWSCTLTLTDADGDLIHAVTGQGVTEEAAQAKAVEFANQWRARKAAEREGESE